MPVIEEGISMPTSCYKLYTRALNKRINDIPEILIWKNITVS
jgi:hypothetical protein